MFSAAFVNNKKDLSVFLRNCLTPWDKTVCLWGFWHKTWKCPFRFLFNRTFVWNQNGCWESGGLLRLHQLHVGLKGTQGFWSASQHQTAPGSKSQNLNNKCSGMANCLESSQGQGRTIEAVTVVNTQLTLCWIQIASESLILHFQSGG